MRGVVEDIGADLVGNRAHFANRVGIEAETAGDCDQLWRETARLAAQPLEIDRHMGCVEWDGMCLKPVETRSASLVMGYMPAHLPGEGHDAIAGLGRSHE